MKKTIITIMSMFALAGCMKDDDFFVTPIAPETLAIDAETGLRFSETSPTDGTMFNIKTTQSGIYSVEILDLTKSLISRNTLVVREGDNIYTLYTRALITGDYTFRFIDPNGNKQEEVKLFIK